jgi:hypothetical protein
MLTSTLFALGIVIAAIVLVFTGQVVSPVAVGMSLLFHAGREEGPANWVDAMKFFAVGIEEGKPLPWSKVDLKGDIVITDHRGMQDQRLHRNFQHVLLSKGFVEKDLVLQKGQRIFLTEGHPVDDVLRLQSNIGDGDIRWAYYGTHHLSATGPRCLAGFGTTDFCFVAPETIVCPEMGCRTMVIRCRDKCGHIVTSGHGQLEALVSIKDHSLDWSEYRRLVPVIEQKPEGPHLNGKRLPAALLTKVLHVNTSEELLYDIKANTGTFVKKMNAFINNSLDVMRESGYCSQLAGLVYTVEDVLAPFRPVSYRRKVAHAPAGQIAMHRLDYVDVDANPTFHRLSFDSTMKRYLQQIHAAGADLEGPLLFQRRLKRNPYIDPCAGKLFVDAPAGMDGVEIACKEMMISSLASYHNLGICDALLDDRMDQVAQAIFDRNPDLYSEARRPDPRKLVNKYLSYKNFSAGVPFSGKGFGKLRTRGDLRKNGWMEPLVKLATMGLTTGEYLPSLYHAFPKSQVVKKSKLEENPAKLRSVTGVSPIVLLQSHMLNWDQNNRHDPSGMGKPGIPLNGAALGLVFDSMAKWEQVHSLDATSFDRNLVNSTLTIVRKVREKGYGDDPVGMAMKAHLKALYDRTQEGYIINLIAEPMAKVDHPILNRLTAAEIDELNTIVSDNSFENAMAPGGIIHKRQGGATGDGDVTFNNTVSMQAILIDAVEATHSHINFGNIFDHMDIANFSDDNMVGSDGSIDWPRVFEYAMSVHNTAFRVESTGTTIYDQTFLGKIPRPAAHYADEFNRLGIPIPQFAVIHEPSMMQTRFKNYKVQASRHTLNDKRHAWYLMQRCAGYLELTAHQPELYDQMRRYTTERIKQLDPSKKVKFKSYDEVVRRWYKPKKDLVWSAQQVRMKPTLARDPLTMLESALAGLDEFSRLLPSAELSIPNEAAPINSGLVQYNIFEDHAWCTFIAMNKRPPSKEELSFCVQSSPFCQFTNVDLWYDKFASTAPVSGPDFNLWKDTATWKVVVYTAVYLVTHRIVDHLHKVPLGSLFAWFIRVYTTSLPRLFSSMSFVYYLGTGTGSHFIASLVPKDPYVHHKKLACMISQNLPDPVWLAMLPISQLLEFAAICTDKVAVLATMELGTSSQIAKSAPGTTDPWVCIAHDIVKVLNTDSVVFTSPCGTGKTRYLPELISRLAKLPVLVCMPRGILCEDHENKSGAYYKKKGNHGVAPHMVCTYGYLYKLLEQSNGKEPHWLENRIVIFDEAHEDSEEWDMLMKTFVPKHRVVMLTATPSFKLNSFVRIDSGLEPLHPVETHSIRLKEWEPFLVDKMREHKCVLAIEPSKEKGKKLVARLKATGLNVKHVHSGDRAIPPGSHIVATSVVDAGITIPGCDCVVDTCQSYYNDGGQLVRLPSSPSTATQRAGRTGRTCPGTVYQLCDPVEPNIRKVCSMESALKRNAASIHYKIQYDIEENTLVPMHLRVMGDEFARFESSPGEFKELASLYHKLTIRRNEESRYVALRNGLAADDLFLLEECNLTIKELPTLDKIKAIWGKCFPHYTNGALKCSRLLMIAGVVKLGTCNSAVRHRRYLPETT